MDVSAQNNRKVDHAVRVSTLLTHWMSMEIFGNRYGCVFHDNLSLA